MNDNSVIIWPANVKELYVVVEIVESGKSVIKRERKENIKLYPTFIFQYLVL